MAPEGRCETILDAFFAGSVRWKADDIHEMRIFSEVLARPGNDILHRQIFNATAAVVNTALQRVITDGAPESTLDVADAGLTSEITVGPGRSVDLQTVKELKPRICDMTPCGIVEAADIAQKQAGTG